VVFSPGLFRAMPVLAIAGLVVSCGSDSALSGPPTGPTQKTVATVSVTPASQTLTAIGATQQFTAVAQGAAGSTIGGKAFSWMSSDTTVAKVNASSGLATAIADGSTTITATVDGRTGSAAATVAQAVATIAVSSSRDTLIILGDTVTFSAVTNDSRGNSVSGKTLTWTSSVASVATINAAGLATAVGNGTTTVTATADGVSGSWLLVVRPTPVAILDMPDSANAGGQLVVNLRLLTEGVAELTGALVATLSWDPAVLQFNAVSAGAIPYFTGYHNNTEGRTRLVVSEPIGIGGNFTALVIMFDVVGVSGATTSLDVSVDQMIAAHSFRDFTSGAVGRDHVLIIR